MELHGRIVKLHPLAQGVSAKTGAAWRRQDFTFGYYAKPQDIYESTVLLCVLNDRIDMLNLAENDEVTVDISLRMREIPVGSGRYFNEIRADRVEVTKRVGAFEPDAESIQPATTTKKEDDLPY